MQPLYFVHIKFQKIIFHSAQHPKLALLRDKGRFYKMFKTKARSPNTPFGRVLLICTRNISVKRVFNYFNHMSRVTQNQSNSQHRPTLQA